MCSTCGCGGSDPVTLTKIGDEKNQQHFHPGKSIELHAGGNLTPNSSMISSGRQVKTVIDIERDILEENQYRAIRNRGTFTSNHTFAINLVSSPGAGKTALLEKSLIHLSESLNCYVIEGDQQTSNDAQRIAQTGVPVVQINTGKGCHLDAEMIYCALDQLQIERSSLLFIENVGNLVCPALFDLGEHARVVIASVTEGEDKPIKYPDIFQSADLCLINKVDLLAYVPFAMDSFKSYAHQVNSKMEILEVSALTGQGMQPWYDWIHQTRAALQMNRLTHPMIS